MVARDNGVPVKKGGRPSKFTPELARRLVEEVGVAGFDDPVARDCGIHPDTLDNWLRRGDEGEEPYAEFAVDYRRAQARWEKAQIQQVQDPRWLLERRNPRVYGKPEAGVSVSVSQTQVAVDPERLKEAKLKVLAALKRDPRYLQVLNEDDGDAGDE